MIEQYFVKYKSKIQGPFTVDQLRILIKKGKLNPEDQVSLDRIDWLRLGDVKGLGSSTQDHPVEDLLETKEAKAPPATKPPSEDEVVEQGPLSTGAVLLRVLGGLCIAVAAIDFITANLGFYDMYAGLPFVYQIGIGPISLGFFTVIILGCIGGYLCRAGKNETGEVTQDHKIMGWVAGSWLLILAFTNVGSMGGVSFNSEANSVMSGSLYDCPNRTLGDMADSFMAYPQWETIYADDGNTYVNLTGEIMVENRSTTALVQFKVNGDEFELQAVEYNGVPQTLFEANHLLETMCASY